MFSLKITAYKNLLIGYWLVIPMCFYLFLFMTSNIKQVSVTNLMVNIPGITLGILMTSLMLIQACLIYFIQQISTSKNGALGQFLNFSFLQQLVTGNLVGAGLCLFYKRSLDTDEKEDISIQHQIIIWFTTGLISILSLLTLFILWRLKGA